MTKTFLVSRETQCHKVFCCFSNQAYMFMLELEQGCIDYFLKFEVAFRKVYKLFPKNSTMGSKTASKKKLSIRQIL